jgi:hypothetical protein
MPAKVREKLHVIKVPLNYKPEIKLANFPPMPQLYLELLENKAKIKSELREKVWEGWSKSKVPTLEKVQQDPQLNRNVEEEKSPTSSRVLDLTKVSKDLKPEEDNKIFNRIKAPLKILDLDESKIREIRTDRIKERYATREGDQEVHKEVQKNEIPRKEVPSQEQPKTLPRNENKKPSLEDILIGKNVPKEETSSTSRRDENKPEIKDETKSETQKSNLPPSLEDIKKGMGGPTQKNLEYVNQDDSDIQKKRDILFKFKILKRQYPDANIPEVSEFSDLKTLERELDAAIRQLSVDACVANYKKYLTIGFFILEWVLGSVFHIEEIKGFAQQQMLGMNQYEALLWQLGEKNYKMNIKWSPELKLIGLIILNGVIFVGSKMLFKAMGSNIMNAINNAGIGGNQTQQSSTNTVNQGNVHDFTNHPAASSGSGTRPRMRPPDIDFGEILNKKTK